MCAEQTIVPSESCANERVQPAVSSDSCVVSSTYSLQGGAAKFDTGKGEKLAAVA